MKTSNLYFVAILIAVFTLSSCQKEDNENLTENTEKTSTEFSEQFFLDEDNQLELDELKKQAESRLQDLHPDIDLEDPDEINALVEAYHLRAISSSENTGIAETRSLSHIRFEAFWWGYHIVVPQSAMKELEQFEKENGALTYAYIAVLSTIAGIATGGAGALLGPVIIINWEAMKKLNRGKGVYLSALWVFPFHPVPTPI
jgi:hypothetical protein